MRYGFYLPTRGGHAPRRSARDHRAARGGAGLPLGDDRRSCRVPGRRSTSKYPYTVVGAFPGSGDALEQLALMAFVAGRDAARCGWSPSVMILPHRNPVLTAKMLATIDVLSQRPRHRRRGRGLAARGVRGARRARLRPARRRRATSTSASSRRCGRSRPPAFAGEFYRFDAHPLSARSRCRSRIRPSGWAATAPPALRRVARHGDGWHPVGANPAVPPASGRAARVADELYRLDGEARDAIRRAHHLVQGAGLRRHPGSGRLGNGAPPVLGQPGPDRGRRRHLCAHSA